MRFAPRYHPVLIEAAQRLDDRSVPIAEICRRVGRVADAHGLARPSYVHLRRLILIERDHEDAARARRRILADAVADAAIGRRVDAYEVAERVHRTEP